MKPYPVKCMFYLMMAEMGMVMANISNETYRSTEADEYEPSTVGCQMHILNRQRFRLECAAMCKEVACIMFAVNSAECAICMTVEGPARVAPFLNAPPASNTYANDALGGE